jgi:hypothetical protein
VCQVGKGQGASNQSYDDYPDAVGVEVPRFTRLRPDRGDRPRSGPSLPEPRKRVSARSGTNHYRAAARVGQGHARPAAAAPRRLCRRRSAELVAHADTGRDPDRTANALDARAARPAASKRAERSIITVSARSDPRSRGTGGQTAASSTPWIAIFSDRPLLRSYRVRCRASPASAAGTGPPKSQSGRCRPQLLGDHADTVIMRFPSSGKSLGAFASLHSP